MSLGGAGPAEQLHGGFDMSDFTPGWPLGSNMAGQPAYNSPEINFGGMQPHGYNTLNPPHTAAQQHQWNSGSHFAPSNPSLNNFGSPKSFDPTAFSNAANLAGLGRQNQFSGATVNNQSNGPLSGTQMVGGG